VRTKPERALEPLGLDRAISTGAHYDRRAAVQRRHRNLRPAFPGDGFAQQLDDGPKILVQRHLQGDFGNLLPTHDRRVEDRIRGQFLIRDHKPRTVVGADVGVGQGNLLDVSGGSTEPGAPVIDWWANGGANQAWIFQSSLYYAPNTYEIVNQNSGQCLTTDGVAGDQLYQWPCTPWSHNQVWVSDIRGFSDGQGHAISNPAFGLVVDVYGNTSWPGAAIDAWYPNGGQNQYFQSDKVAVY